MKMLFKLIILSGLAMSLTACVHGPHPYGTYSGNGGYYPGSGSNQGYGHHQHNHRPPPQAVYPRPYGGYNSNNYYQNNYYNRPQPRPYQGQGRYDNNQPSNWNNSGNQGNHHGHGRHDDDHGRGRHGDHDDR